MILTNTIAEKQTNKKKTSEVKTSKVFIFILVLSY